MAAPTSQHEVTARKLSDTVSGLWGKVKDTFSKKADSVYYVAGTTDYAAWAANTAYAVNDNVVYSGKAYYCKTAHTSGSTWDSSKWTAIATPVLKGTINGITALDTGMKIAYKMPITGGATSTYLNINGLGNVYIMRNTGHTATQLVAGTVVFLAYDGSAWKWADFDSNSTYSGMITAYLDNAGDTAKAASSTNFRLTTGVTMLLANKSANTKAAALTLNVNSTGAKTLYINGSVSSSSNYTIPSGTFWIHYDGTYWQLYTDGRLPVKELKLTTALSVAQGGTGATDAATARTNLGAAASSHAHGNIANGGTLTDTAAAAAGDDYIVIRDATDNKIQTSTIKGVDVADAVTKKHSHSTLTLSTTAQAYDGTHTLALPANDPYTSARTPSSHASSATTYGVGTTSKYGHVKLATGDMNGATNEDGVAVSKNHTHSQYATAANAALTGTPTAPTAGSGDSSTQIATTAFVQDAVAQGLSVSDAMIYKGTVTLGASSPGGYTVAASKGHTYKVVANGTTTKGYVDGVAVKAGDMVICNTDDTAAATSSNYSTIAAKWDFVQGNLDGVVVGPGSATAGHVAVFDGSTGKLIKDGTYTIGKSVPSDAKFTDTTYTFDGTYNASTNKAATVSTVTNAINALDGTVSGTAGAGKTLTAFSQTDGKVSATFGNISITKSQVSDFPTSMPPASHTHGNIANDGKVGTTADLPLKTTTGGAVAAGAWASSASDTGSSSSAGTATTFSRGDHTHKVSVATGDSAGQVKIAGQNVSVNGWASKANDSSVVHLSGNETITGVKTFNNDMSPRQAHAATVQQSKAFTCSAITLYEDWDASQKDGNHFRAWTIDLTSTIVTADTHATIVVKIIGSYYYTPSNGALQKEITFQIHNGNVVVSASDYTIAQSPCADEFKISGIYKSGSSYLVQVVNSKPTQNNYPLVLEIEMLSRNTSAVLDNVTMTGSIISGWPSWAGDINTPAKVTASGYPVLTDHGLMNTNGLNISRRLAAGSSNTSINSDGSELTIQSVNRDTYFGFLSAEDVPAGANVAVSFDVEYSGSDDGQFSWEFKFQGQVSGTASIYLKGSGHYSGVCTLNEALVKNSSPFSFFDDTERPATMPQAAMTIKNLKVEVGPIVTGYSKPLADVAFSGAYSDLSGKPTLGTASSKSLVTAWSDTPSDANVPSEKLVYDSMRQAPYALAHYHSEAGTTRWVCLAKVYVPVTLSGYAGEMFAMSFRDSGADDIQGVLCVTNSEYGNANGVCAKFIVLGLRNTLYQSKVYILKESDSTYYIYSRLPANACAKITPMLLHGTITYPNTYTTTEPSGLVNVPLVQMPPLRVVDGPQSSYEPGVCYLI